MEKLATAYAAIDWTTTPPEVDVPRHYNAAVDFVDRHVAEGRGSKTAFIDDSAALTFDELAQQVNRAGNMLRNLGLRQEDRVLLVAHDSNAYPAIFWGALKAGIVVVAVNTLLTADDYRYMLADSRARAVIVQDVLVPELAAAAEGQVHLQHRIAVGDQVDGWQSLDGLMHAASDQLEPAATVADDVAFWLYSSGSTGRPKGAPHIHSDLVYTVALYGVPVLGITQDDVVFSAAKLFFAYGLGNGMTFPMYVGATAVLMAERPTPESVAKRLKDHQPSIFYGVPTLYAGVLTDEGINRETTSQRLRICVSAGEALPEDVALRWQDRFGAPIADGIGSTELLHIFLSNRPDDIRYGTTGKPVPGYDIRLTDDDGNDVADGDIGDLWVSGPTAAPYYWNNRAKSIDTFHGPWTRTGDKYVRDADGYFTYAGRSDDMLKVSGIWVSPFEVESALTAHPAVIEAAIVGRADGDDLVKPEAFLVLNDGFEGSDDLATELQAFVKDRLAPYKYPRWINFVAELPKTATGKTQRFKLRQ